MAKHYNINKNTKDGDIIPDAKVNDKLAKRNSRSNYKKGSDTIKQTKKQVEKKINTSKTGPKDIFEIYAKNENEFKIEVNELGNNSGEISLTPYNYTKIHDIDVYPIIGALIDTKSVLANGKSKVGAILARFKNQLQFPANLSNSQLLALAQQASHNMGEVAELAPMIASKVVKVNVNGVRPFYVPLLPMNILGHTRGNSNATRVPIAEIAKYAVEDFIDKRTEQFFLPLLDNEGTDFDINTLFIRFKRLANQSNNDESNSPVKDGNAISAEAVNAFGYLQQFLDKYLAAVDSIFTRVNTLTKVAEHVRHWSTQNNHSVNDMFGQALNSTSFRGAIASLIDSRIILRSRRTLNKNHSGDMFNISKSTSGRTTAMDVVSTTYFNFTNKSNNLVNDPHLNWVFSDNNIDFATLPNYEWNATDVVADVNYEKDFVCDVVIARDGAAAEVDYITVQQQRDFVNHLLKVFSLLEPTNIPWDMMVNSRNNWVNWRNAVITAMGMVKQDLVQFNRLWAPFYQVLSRAETYGLNTGYTVSTEDNYNVVLSTAIVSYSGSQNIKVLNDLAKVTSIQNPSDGSTIETYHNKTLYNSIISESAIQYFTGEEGLYYPFYVISKPTAFITGNSGVGYKMVNNVTNLMPNKPIIAERQSSMSLIVYNTSNTKFTQQDWNADFSAINLFNNYSSKVQMRINSKRANITWDSSTFCTVDYHVDSLYNEVVKLISESGLKQVTK